MNHTLVIFHRSDLDGLCCEAIARKAFGEQGVTYLGWEYNDPVPDLSLYPTVYLLDISLPIEVMKQHADRLIWIDHHQTAIEALKGTFIRGYRIDGVAACRLAWQWFLKVQRDAMGMVWLLPDKTQFVDRMAVEPYAVQLLGEYDIWDKRNPDTDIFQLGMLAEQSPRWDLIFQLGRLTEDIRGARGGPEGAFEVERIIDRGRAIQAFTEVQNAKIATERGFDLRWEGLFFRVLNTARSTSLTFKAALRPEHDGCLSYFWNGRKWIFSLYGVPGKGDVDLSVVAAKHGGGGHKQACGGSFTVLPPELGGPRGG